jgi:class 3 adenylate cyclase
MAVHVAARIQGLAGAGHILVSSTVKDIGEWRLFSLAE